MDVAFVLDTSGSIEEIYNEQIRWTVALSDALPIAKEAVRLSTIQYAGYPLTEFSLDTYNDKDDVVHHLREMSFQSGVTRTGYALRRAEDELFNDDRGARRKASKIVALFTDGLSIDDPLKPSEHLRLQRGVKIYVVSVSADGFGPEMQRIAGESANVYGPEDLQLLKERLLKDVEEARICESDRTSTRSSNGLTTYSSSTKVIPIEIANEVLNFGEEPVFSTPLTTAPQKLHDNEYKPSQRVALHSAQATTPSYTATEIFERVLKSVKNAYTGATYSTTTTTSVNGAQWKPRKLSNVVALKNKPRTKKTRKIIRRKLKRVPGIPRDEQKRKVHKVIRKKVRRVVSQATSLPYSRELIRSRAPSVFVRNPSTLSTPMPTLIPQEAQELVFTSTTLRPMQFVRTTRPITNIPDITFSSQDQRPFPILPISTGGDANAHRIFASKTLPGNDKSAQLSVSHEGSVGVPRTLVPITTFKGKESTMFLTPHEGAVEVPRAFAQKSLQADSLRERAVKTTARPLSSAGNSRILAPPLAPLPLSSVLAPPPPASRAFQTNGTTQGRCPFDILFVVDSSGSVGEIYEKQKEFLFDLLSSIEPENQSHRVGLIQFAGAKLQKTEWSFDTYRDSSQLMEAFNGVRHFTGTTYIGAALESAVQLLESRRPDVLTLVILISDGYSDETNLLELSAPIGEGRRADING
ncbi:von Willebrand factor type A domain protein [Teladorsagia circumcincta]|uniref:von Willebrand factor type A domain protein n=1 Tax=Teladorsagia circumcincta TaxID=45464 RepID=A0A2G9V2I4_TELCI|nr:von Willebrand factor type A domain protein [Teladorsagia circumcincta]